MKAFVRTSFGVAPALIAMILPLTAQEPLPPAPAQPPQEPRPLEPATPGVPIDSAPSVAPSTPATTQPRRENPAPTGITAMEALRRLTERYGSNALTHIIEMRGPNGQAQPDSWRVVAVDLGNAFLARTYFVNGRGVGDEGESKKFFPDNPPLGFVATSKLRIGSHDAFIALDKVAGAAKVGFDRISYRLRGKEGTNEPIWSLTALNRDGIAVGFVDVSGISGKVLRTVWLRRADSKTLPTIEDSALRKLLRR